MQTANNLENFFLENFYPIYTGMEQTPITKKFIQEVERLRGTPAGKDYKEIAAKIGMDKKIGRAHV